MNKHLQSFRLAINGVRYAVKTQLNFTVHLCFTGLAVFLGVVYRITYIEWIVIILTIVLVLVTEMINTSIESMTDLLTSDYRKEAKIAKDVSAGMVLTAAVGAVVVGLAIFGPRLFNR